MLVYRDQKQAIQVARSLAYWLERVRQGGLEHQDVVALLIEFGELEAGILDAEQPEIDSFGPLAQSLREASLTLGHLFYHSWRRTDQAQGWLHKAEIALTELQIRLPHGTVYESVPEGYAYYSLYPETYLSAADQFFTAARPDRVVVIGLRNIGTSLSAVVGATLEELGCELESYTVRPRGYAYSRRLALSPQMQQDWQAQRDAYFLVVDEGPGMSGSSFTSVSLKLAELGVPDERIVFFPSWNPDGSRFVSGVARQEWPKHPKYTTTFEQVWLESGRLAESLPGDHLIDLSGGKWRPLVYANECEWPAIQPQHEKRKYLGTASSSLKFLAKFAGLGRYGTRQLERAEQLAAAGMAPRPLGLANGFLLTEFVPGRPLVRQKSTRALLDTVARYLAFVSRTWPAPQATPVDALFEMVHVNVEKGLGGEWLKQANRLSKFRAVVANAPAVALDARMSPQEWLDVGGRYIKTDAVEHNRDHFFPGPQSPAWDLAATCIEFSLDQAEQDYLLGSFRELTGSNVDAYLVFYFAAFLAFRLGYVTMAAESLQSEPEAARFRRQAARYAARLRRILEQL